MNWHKKQTLTLVYAFLALLALLGAGALHLRWQFLTRGIPAGLLDPIPQGGAQLGLNVALGQYSAAELERQLTRIEALGIAHLKQTFYYAQGFDWQASDRLLTAVADFPFEVTLLLNGDPANQFAPPDPAAYAAWAGAVAARYGEQIDHYIIWDEPNLAAQWGHQPVNPAAYAALLTAASTAIRAADPTSVIIAAPLAPTSERGPQNLAEPLFLQRLYEAGAGEAFDVVAGKPYGFDSGVDDRRVALETLNFSRLILLREVLEANGEGHKAVWAGHWGWNSLPEGWAGQPSVWGQTDAQTQITHLLAGVERAQREWPWAGVLFAEGWQADAPAEAAVHGFDLAENPYVSQLATLAAPRPAPTGFHLAAPDSPHQAYEGGWEFSPAFGADVSEVPAGQPPDRVTLTFWGTDVGVRVRRADFRARFYIIVDGLPANGLPRDNGRASLVLTAADPSEDYLSTEWVARRLDPGPHTMTIVAERGWDQWALNGFSVGYRPKAWPTQIGMAALIVAALGLAFLAVRTGRQVAWSAGRVVLAWRQRTQMALAAGLAMAITLTGWLTWGAQAAGVYRRLGDGAQLGLVAASAVLFYVTPWFFVYLLALLCFLVLVSYRPLWGLVIITLCFPFYVAQVLKPVYQYRFSPVEVFTLVTAGALLLARWREYVQTRRWAWPSWRRADTAVALFVVVATLSLFFTERLDVATNEWRLVIVEPALFYALLRGARLTGREMRFLLDAFVVSGLVIALIGLAQYGAGVNLIAAEGGLMRLRATYGSPNNVALYLGRIWPLLLAMLLFSSQPLWGRTRRTWYGLALLPIGLALLLSFSRGALLLGLPASTFFLFVCWQRQNGRRVWPWLLVGGVAAVLGYGVALQIPSLAGRLDWRSATTIFRLNLWQASLNMIRDQPVWGVGLDNFLYAYRGRYILASAWQEPHLNHPHNILFDFATRLGLLGLAAGAWLVGCAGRLLWQQRARRDAWQPVVLGLLGALIHMLVHGLVDHSFFLVDLAFAFYLMLGVAIWVQRAPFVAHE